MKETRKFTKAEHKKRKEIINKVEKKFREAEAILSEMGTNDVGGFISLSMREDGGAFENISMLLGKGSNIIHALDNSFEQNEAFRELAMGAIRHNAMPEDKDVPDFISRMM